MPLPRKSHQVPSFLLCLLCILILYSFIMEFINSLTKEIYRYFLAMNLVIGFDFRVQKRGKNLLFQLNWKKRNENGTNCNVISLFFSESIWTCRKRPTSPSRRQCCTHHSFYFHAWSLLQAPSTYIPLQLIEYYTSKSGDKNA